MLTMTINQLGRVLEIRNADGHYGRCASVSIGQAGEFDHRHSMALTVAETKAAGHMLLTLAAAMEAQEQSKGGS